MTTTPAELIAAFIDAGLAYKNSLITNRGDPAITRLALEKAALALPAAALEAVQAGAMIEATDEMLVAGHVAYENSRGDLAVTYRAMQALAQPQAEDKNMSDTLENPRFAEARAAGKTCFEIDAMGGCIICWGKGRWLDITDADWKAAGRNAKRTAMSCPHCRGSGLKPGRADTEDKT